jgi:N-acetyl sugar amidotransferase
MSGANQICVRCVMDASVPDIAFDAVGCNYCTEMLARGLSLVSTGTQSAARLAPFVETVKRSGRGRRYDCVVGLSGGVDSSWALHSALELGLRPLAVHMDNGWNSELAQHNIEQLITRLGVDLYTHVIDWSEYRKLMQAFFDADVVDVELLYDNAMMAVNMQQASRHGLTYILSGVNHATEGMRIPTGWNWFKSDRRNILSIWRRFGDGSHLRTFPSIGTAQMLYYTYARRIRWIPFLDYVDYNKPKALGVLQERFGYKPYPYKHYESVFTRFYQGHILPKKFGIDKRRLHLGALVVSGQMTREDALADLARSPYPSEDALQQDIAYFLKKMGWSAAQLETYLARPAQPHAIYGTEKPFSDALVGFRRRVLAGGRAGR